MGTFEGTFGKKNLFEIIPITLVVTYNKDRGLLQIDVLKIDTITIINSIKGKENNIGLLRAYWTSIRLKENYHPSYVETGKILIHILPMVEAKF